MKIHKWLWAGIGAGALAGCSPEVAGPEDPAPVVTPSGEVVPADKPAVTGGVMSPGPNTPGYPEGAPASYPRPDENATPGTAAEPARAEPAEADPAKAEVVPAPETPATGDTPDTPKANDAPPADTPPQE